MHTLHRFILCVMLLLLPVGVLAAAPSDVRGITAEAKSDGVHVKWLPVSGDIASYRIFYSHVSILDNNALYDEFVSTEKPVTEFVLQNLPQVSDLYITVLAVNSTGEESPLFEEEAHVTLSAMKHDSSSSIGSAQSNSMSSSSARIAIESPMLRAYLAKAVSSTGVLLTFSDPVVLTNQTARVAFTIKTGSGVVLSIYRIETNGTGVLLSTLPQVPNRAYRVHIDPSLRGSNGSAVLTMDPEQPDLLFMGTGGTMKMSSSSKGMTPGSMGGSVTPQNGHLPQTGAGTLSLLAIAGASAGVHVQRKRKQTK